MTRGCMPGSSSSCAHWQADRRYPLDRRLGDLLGRDPSIHGERQLVRRRQSGRRSSVADRYPGSGTFPSE